MDENYHTKNLARDRELLVSFFQKLITLEF